MVKVIEILFEQIELNSDILMFGEGKEKKDAEQYNMYLAEAISILEKREELSEKDLIKGEIYIVYYEGKWQPVKAVTPYDPQDFVFVFFNGRRVDADKILNIRKFNYTEK